MSLTSIKNTFNPQKNTPKYKGQAVIEYAGALVISAVLMAAILLFLPDDVYAFVVQMQEDIFSYLLEALQEGLG